VIAVNVRRSFRHDESASLQAEAVQGDWAGLSPQTCESQVGECLFGVQKNHVVWLGVIESWHPVVGDRVRFVTRALSKPETKVVRSSGVALGATAPPWACWRQGQANPVRPGPRVPLQGPAGTAPETDTVQIGVFKIVHIPGSGELRVFVPAGAQVVITSES